MTTHRLDELEVIDLEPDALSEVVSVLARGMRDDPMHVAASGNEPEERQGIGSRLLTEHCRRLDAAREVGYLETDERENAVFYRRQGFEIVDQADVIGVASRFMRRSPRAAGESR